jgi:hypothetical protein
MVYPAIALLVHLQQFVRVLGAEHYLTGLKGADGVHSGGRSVVRSDDAQPMNQTLRALEKPMKFGKQLS